MSRTPIHGNPRNEYPQEAINRNLREMGLDEQNAAEEELIGHIPVVGLLRSLGQNSQILNQLKNPELLRNTAGKGLETNIQRGAPADTYGKEADVQMMSEGGVAGMDGLMSNPTPEMPESEEETAGTDIPEEIKEYLDAVHKQRAEARPDEGWRIRPSERPESEVPYKTNEKAEPDVLDQLRGITGMADGGMVADPNQDLQTIADLSGEAPFMPSLLQDPPAPKPAPAPAAPVPPPVAAIKAPPAPAAPGLTDQDFMDRANKILGLNPQQQAGFMKMLGQNQQKSQIGAAVAGIGDAIASGGTLGKVNPGALNKAEDLANNATRQGLEGMQTIRENQGKAQEMADKLESRDPNSPLSKWAQKAYGSVGKKLGLDLSHASAALISDVAGKGVDALNTEFQNQIKTMGLDLQKQQLGATVANQKAEREIAEEGRTAEAAKTLANRGVIDTISGAIPGTAAHTAKQVLESQAQKGLFTPDVLAYAQKHGIQPEQAQRIKEQRTKGR